MLRAEGKPRAALEALERALSSEGLGITYLLVKLSVVEALESASELGDTGKVEELLGRIEALRAGEHAAPDGAWRAVPSPARLRLRGGGHRV